MKKIIIYSILITATVFSYAFCQEAAVPSLTGAVPTVRMIGAMTVAELLNPHKEAIEKKLGCKLVIVGKTAGLGLIYLEEGKCDAALTATDLEKTVAAAKIGKNTIKTDGYVASLIKNDEIVFIVNPKNDVTKLTDLQLKYLLSGWYPSWKDVGGKDMPVVVCSDKSTGATRSIINKEIMKDADFSPKTKEFIFPAAIIDEVATNLGAIAGISKMYANDNKVKILDARTLPRALGIITKGEPTGKMKEVIEAYKDVVQ